jgi:broad specificity phosphatase PhoE
MLSLATATIGAMPLLVALLCLLALAPVVTAETPATTVLLIRHAEKATEPADDPPLSEVGQRRVIALGELLAESSITRIFASERRRTQDTVKPLAERLGLPVEVVPAKDPAALAAAIRARPGGTVLVAGHSNTLGAIAEALGAPPPPAIADDDYDNFYVVTVPASGPATLLRLRFSP